MGASSESETSVNGFYHILSHRAAWEAIHFKSDVYTIRSGHIIQDSIPILPVIFLTFFIFSFLLDPVEDMYDLVNTARLNMAKGLMRSETKCGE